MNQKRKTAPFFAKMRINWSMEPQKHEKKLCSVIHAVISSQWTMSPRSPRLRLVIIIDTPERSPARMDVWLVFQSRVIIEISCILTISQSLWHQQLGSLPFQWEATGSKSVAYIICSPAWIWHWLPSLSSDFAGKPLHCQTLVCLL